MSDVVKPRLADRRGLAGADIGRLHRALRLLAWYLVVGPVSVPATWVAMGTRIRGRRHLRALRGGAVLVCNHVHPLDSLAVVRAAWPRIVTFNSQETNFRLPVAGRILTMFGTLPVASGPLGASEFLRHNGRVLARGGLVALYPEGDLAYECPDLRPMWRGGFVVAARERVPVVPIVLRDGGRLRGRPWGRRRLDVVVGAPVWPGPGTSREAAAALRDEATARMRALLAR